LFEVNWTIWASAGAALVLVLGGAVWWRRRRGRQRGPRDALEAIAAACLHDVLVPDGMGGQIYVEYLLLTNRGIVVVDVKDFAGVVFASDQMQEWTVIGKGRRFGFPNPQGTLLDRVAAVRALVRGIPVEGHIVFASEADFSKGRPRHVLLASELDKRFKQPAGDDRERLTDAFAPHWARIKEVVERADSPRAA
jgi:Nuclease-related domain